MKNVFNIKKKGIAILVVISLIFTNGFAQDGAKLFKQNCSACHKVDKGNIGPQLRGAKTKWEDAGEGDLIYDWVADPSGLYNSGKSQMAKEIWDFNASSMTAMTHLSKDEVDAIFNYVDSKETIAPPATVDSLSDSNEGTTIKERSSFSVTEIIIFSIISLFLIITTLLLRKTTYVLSGKHEEEKERQAEEVVSLSKVLTGAVDIEYEDSILLDHDYDGIKELDNDLPPWWVWMFYGTIVFGIIYVSIYHIFDSAPLQVEAYEIEMAEAHAEVEAYKLSTGMAIDENNVEILTDEKSLDAGMQIFTENCVVCHQEKGQGSSGPNLTDEYWIYGGDVKEVFSTVKYGTKKGMPAHENKLNPIELQNVVSFVKSLPFTEGKAPEGEKE